MASNNYSNQWLDTPFDPWDNTIGVSAPLGQGIISASNASTTIANQLSPQYLAKMNIDEMNHLMKGEMVSVGITYAEAQRENLIESIGQNEFKDHVKRQLCESLVKEMMNNSLIEFTMANDPNRLEFVYRARAYVMPDHMTKILREYVQRNT